MSDEIFTLDEGDNAIQQEQDVRELLGNEKMIAIQKRIIGIQTGSEPPPDWFERTGYDTGIVRVPDANGQTIDFEIVAASSGAMEEMDRATSKTERMREQNVVIESISKIPEEYKVRRPFKINNKTYDTGHHFENLWNIYSSKEATARQILDKYISGRIYTMIKMATMWLSKVTVSDLIELDPEEGSDTHPTV